MKLIHTIAKPNCPHLLAKDLQNPLNLVNLGNKL